ncbi:GroES-like protein [Rhizodiscina lignyota]|uniref:GroES-like protein n=1 Tax=Rhizodiscina lignyota TaxID=1504668 RepID=A0A9P4M7F8_9PEZI|nr:GroES-like protein [Rhizodiscina lignyota]
MTANGESFTIPRTYKAVEYDKPGTISTKVVERQTPEPRTGEVLVRLTHSGVCHSDAAIMQNLWKGFQPTQPGHIGGHEGVGIVHKMGPGTEMSSIQVGNRVGIKWVASMCGSCPACIEGLESRCANGKKSGYTGPGTFQQYLTSPANYVTPIPDGLDSADAAPMLCAGITVYTGLKKTNAQPGQWVVITGAGGGLGHIATQLGSHGMALRIIGVDHGSKKDLVLESGAEAFVDITQFDDTSIVEEVKRITGGRGARAAVACTGNNRAYAQALAMLGLNGTLVCVGVPEGDAVLIPGSDPRSIIFRGLNITYTSVGNRRDAIEVLDFAKRGVVKSHSRVEKMEDLTKVFEEMSQGKLQGRVVLDLE